MTVIYVFKSIVKALRHLFQGSWRCEKQNVLTKSVNLSAISTCQSFKKKKTDLKDLSWEIPAISYASHYAIYKQRLFIKKRSSVFLPLNDCAAVCRIFESQIKCLSAWCWWPTEVALYVTTLGLHAHWFLAALYLIPLFSCSLFVLHLRLMGWR